MARCSSHSAQLSSRYGTAYPDVAWEPKEAFRAVASYYATRASLAPGQRQRM